MAAAATSAITANRWIFRLWMMAIVVPVMLYEVVARYLFNAPTVWGMELAVLLFGPYFLLGRPLPSAPAKAMWRWTCAPAPECPAWQRRLDLLNYPVIVCSAPSCCTSACPWRSVRLELRETSFSAWNPPIWPVKAAVPLALALMLLQALVEFLHVLFRPTNDDGSTAACRGMSAQPAILLLMFGGLTLFMLTGLPIAFVLGGLSLLFTVTLWEPNAVIVLVLQIFDTMKSEALLAIPLFILMACILQRSGVIEDLYHGHGALVRPPQAAAWPSAP
jgi:TRAP-type mannitol/chloroaromatic compound transport system permease small subunit